MALNNLKALMKEPVLDEKKPSLLKRKPGMTAPKKPSGLMSRLTGGK